MTDYKYEVAIGFCSYFDQETGTLGEYEPIYEAGRVALRLPLYPHWRIRGFAALLRTKAKKLALMGTPLETAFYKQELVEKYHIAPERIVEIETKNSTKDAALTMRRYLEAEGITADEWILITSDYHLQRVIDTAEVLHNFLIRHKQGAESCLLEEAFMLGGEAAQIELLEEMYASRDAHEERQREWYERKGCAQLRADPRSYHPKKQT